jgi:hypothetical protein
MNPLLPQQRMFRALFAVSIILGIAMGTRNAFSGLFLQPISADLKWGREVFSLAVALQNLVWGASQPRQGVAGTAPRHANPWNPTTGHG